MQNAAREAETGTTRRRGVVDNRTFPAADSPMAMFDRDFPGHYLRLIKRVKVSIIALVPPVVGIRATLSTPGTSRAIIAAAPIFQTVVVRREPQTVALSSPRDATGLFDLDPQPDLLLPFEGMGVDTAWEFRMPKAANPFDYRTIADILITLDYTALDDPDYRQQIVKSLDPNVHANRPFSFRYELADQWYELHNPQQSATPMTVTFTTSRADFPPNLDEPRIEEVALYFARKEGESAKISVTTLTLTPQDGGAATGGAATSIDGVISTRRGNATPWLPLRGKAPFGRWQLALPLSARHLFQSNRIDDVLLVISYSGRTAPWPA